MCAYPEGDFRVCAGGHGANADWDIFDGALRRSAA
jgi:hypothetical protein